MLHTLSLSRFIGRVKLARDLLREYEDEQEIDHEALMVKWREMLASGRWAVAVESGAANRWREEVERKMSLVPEGRSVDRASHCTTTGDG